MATFLLYDRVTAKAKVKFESLYLHSYLTKKFGAYIIGMLSVSSIKVSHHGCHGNSFGIWLGHSQIKSKLQIALHFYLTYRVVTGTIGKLHVRTIEMSHHGSHANISGMC